MLSQKIWVAEANGEVRLLTRGSLIAISTHAK